MTSPGNLTRDQLADRLAMFDSDRAGRMADYLAPLVDRIADERAADELEAEAAYDDQAADEQYPRRLFAARLRERADNLRAG